MVLVKVLKRKDASSVLLAVLIALVVWQPLTQVTATPTAKILGLGNNQYVSYTAPGAGWKVQYLYPVVQIIVMLVVLEILGWIYVLGKGVVKK